MKPPLIERESFAGDWLSQTGHSDHLRFLPKLFSTRVSPLKPFRMRDHISF
jgi:hypothetical protein